MLQIRLSCNHFIIHFCGACLTDYIPCSVEGSYSTNALRIINSGQGRAGLFQIQNDSSIRPTLQATTNGSGHAIIGSNNGTGGAGMFGIDGQNNNSTVLSATTWGMGKAGKFHIQSSNNMNPALEASTTGGGPALLVKKSEVGPALVVNGKGGVGASAAVEIDGGIEVNSGGAWIKDSGSGPAVWALAEGVGHAGWFSGDVNIWGTLSKSGGGFKIDHPLDPDNKYLYHSFVESPDMMNVYNGNVTLNKKGEAWVELPAYFEALNEDFRYQLTPIGAPAPDLHVAKKISDSFFMIAGGKTGIEVSWQVTGIRQDAYAKAHRIASEVKKEAENRGKYLHPKELGKPEKLGIGWEKRQSMVERSEKAVGTE
jgi:hypothetical protein